MKGLFLFLLLFQSPLYAEQASQANSTQQLKWSAPPNQERLYNEDVAKRYGKNQALWLGDGNSKFLYLKTESQAESRIGTALLIPEWGKTPTTPIQINRIREGLSAFGWDTFTMSPPTPYPIDNYQMQEKPEQAKKQQAEYENKIKARLELLLTQPEFQNGFQLVVAQGVSGFWLSQLYQQQALVNPDAIVLLNIYFPHRDTQSQLAKDVARLEIPVLDITTRDANSWVTTGVIERKHTVKSQLKLDYRAQALDNSRVKENISKIIYGWTSFLGWH